MNGRHTGSAVSVVAVWTSRRSSNRARGHESWSSPIHGDSTTRPSASLPTDNVTSGSSTTRHRDPDPPPVGFRLPKASAPVDQMRAAAPGLRHRGTHDRRRTRAARRVGAPAGRPRRGAAFFRVPAGGGRGDPGAAAARLSSSAPHSRLRALVLHADGDRVHARPQTAGGGLRLHGRALGVRGCACCDATARRGTARKS